MNIKIKDGRNVTVGCTVECIIPGAWYGDDDCTQDYYGQSFRIVEDSDSTERYINPADKTIEFSGVKFNSDDFA